MRMFQASVLMSQNLRIEANVFSRCLCKWHSLSILYDQDYHKYSDFSMRSYTKPTADSKIQLASFKSRVLNLSFNLKYWFLRI